MAQGIYRITEEFEKALSDYTGAPYVVTVDNASNALYLCLLHEKVAGKEITIPCRTYPSVPAMILLAGGKIKFLPVKGKTLKGEYRLAPTRIWDSALRFTHDMFRPGQMQCISFTGAYKHLKLSKGGAILTDDVDAFRWFKKARFSGRGECSYHEDYFTQLGFNFYMEPEKATRGLLLIGQFYDTKGNPKDNKDVELPYPDLSKFPIFKEGKFNSRWEYEQNIGINK